MATAFDVVGRIFSITCTVIACLTSFFLIFRHLTHNKFPALRTCTIRILLMIPIYAIEACVALAQQVMPYGAEILKFVREMYEAVVIFSFLQFVLVCAGGPQAVVQWETPAVPTNFWKDIDDIVGSSTSAPHNFWDEIDAMLTGVGVETGQPREHNHEAPTRSVQLQHRSRGNPWEEGRSKKDPWQQPSTGATMDLRRFWSNLDSLVGQREARSAEADAEEEEEFWAHLDAVIERRASAGVSAHVENKSLADHDEFHHLWPFSKCFAPWSSARAMIKWCVRGALLYVLAGVVCALIGLGAWAFSPKEEHILLKICGWILSLTQAIALMALADMAHNFMDKLRGIRPLGKFLAVKLVIFFSFWQGLVILLIEKLGGLDGLVDPSQGWYSTKQVATAIQNILICFEMAAASIAHIFVFPTTDFEVVLTAQAITIIEAKSRHGHSGRFGSALDIVGCKDIARTAWDASFPEVDKTGTESESSAESSSEEEE